MLSWGREDLLCRSVFREALLTPRQRWESQDSQNSSLSAYLTLSRSFGSWPPGNLRQGWGGGELWVQSALVKMSLPSMLTLSLPTCRTGSRLCGVSMGNDTPWGGQRESLGRLSPGRSLGPVSQSRVKNFPEGQDQELGCWFSGDCLLSGQLENTVFIGR